MVALRQMGIALLAWLIAAAVIGPAVALIQLVTGEFRPPTELAGTILQLASLFAFFVVVQQIDIRLERWDAIRSGRPPQR